MYFQIALSNTPTVLGAIQKALGCYDYTAGADRALEALTNAYDQNMMSFPSEDLMNNLPKAMSNIGKAMGGGGSPTDSPTFKISMREYEDMAIKVGDKMIIEIKKVDIGGN